MKNLQLLAAEYGPQQMAAALVQLNLMVVENEKTELSKHNQKLLLALIDCLLCDASK